MRVILDIKTAKGFTAGSVATIGVFDAMHEGHRKLVKETVSAARGLGVASVMVTFDPYPAEVLAGQKRTERLLTKKEKIGLAGEMGLSSLVFIRFGRAFAGISAENFVKNYLVGRLNVKRLVIGDDFSLGKGRRGTPAFLAKEGKEYGFSVRVVKTVKLLKYPVKSSLIRKLVSEGDVAKAAMMLGRRYLLSGTVIRGKGRGKKLGFPTANIRPSEKLVPGSGIYASFTLIGGNRFKSVTYIGRKPTFAEKQVSVETYMLDFNGNLYGKNVAVEFVEKLRDDAKFKSVDELVIQIRKDVKRAERILGSSI